MIKCVIFDIGNTLISKNGNNLVEPILKSDIKRLREQGVIVGVASMRTYKLSKMLLQGIDLDFYICLSGAQIYINDNLYYDVPIKHVEVSHSCSIYYSNNHTYALDAKCSEVARKKGFVVEEIRSDFILPLYNIALMDVKRDRIDDYKNSYHIEYWDKIKVLVLQPKEKSKAKAVDIIRNYYQIEQSEVLGYGDGPNDIGFLKKCGLSVAMGNDYKELLDATTFSTDIEGRLGVSKSLRKLKLINDVVIFFIESLNEVGGMEIHGMHFIDYFKNLSNLYVVTHKSNKNTLVYANNIWITENISNIGHFVKNLDSNNTMLFFNSGHWIEEMLEIKSNIKNSVIFYRTGGNEIISAPLSDVKTDVFNRKEIWKNAINQSIDFLITNSSLTEERLLNFGIERKLFRRVLGGVDSTKIFEYKKHYMDIRDDLLFDNKKINLVSVSRFEPYKRVDLLLESMKYLDSDDYHLYLIGNGLLYNQIYKEYSDLKNVTFLGKQNYDNALKYICVADFYVQFSGDTLTNLNGLNYIHTEGMGRTILEAITAKTFVIATKCGAFSEIITSKNGILIDSNDPNELAKVITDQTPLGISGNIDDSYDFNYVFDDYLRIWRKNG